METTDELIAGIMRDAQEEAEKIIKNAETAVRDKKQAEELQLKSLEREALKKESLQVGAIEKSSNSAVSVEKKHRSLTAREEILKKITEKIKEKISGMAGSSNYPEIVRGWIIEAAIGLGEDEAVVNCSAKESDFITEKYLSETEKKYSEITGRKITLSRSADNLLAGQGITLASRINKTVYNNQTGPRITRFHSQILKIVYSGFFDPDKE